MRRFVRVLVAVTSVLTVVPVVDDPRLARAGAADDAAFVQRLMHHTSLRIFIAAADQRRGPTGRVGDRWFDWSSDACSAPLIGSTGRSFDFTASCRRHDFGYRNAKLMQRRYGGQHWSGATRLRIDRQFLTDMLGHCRSRWLVHRPTCTAWAYTFYGAVRLAGGP